MNKQTVKLFTGLMTLLAMLVTHSVSAAPGDQNKGGSSDWSQQWYLRLTVVSPDDDSLRDRGNVLGQLDDSVLGYDRHDLIELNPFASPYLTLVFPHDDWLDAGNYSSDYHATDAEASDQWDFQVHSDNSNRNITLYWDNLKLVERKDDAASKGKGRNKSQQMDSEEELVERMWLEDTLTGERVYAVDSGQLQSYSFNMEGENVRSFRWVMEDRFGRKSKPGKLKTNNAAKTYKPGGAQDAHDRINGLPPAVGRK